MTDEQEKHIVDRGFGEAYLTDPVVKYCLDLYLRGESWTKCLETMALELTKQKQTLEKQLNKIAQAGSPAIVHFRIKS